VIATVEADAVAFGKLFLAGLDLPRRSRSARRSPLKRRDLLQRRPGQLPYPALDEQAAAE
jgi:2,4-dienoyl-CoA reductase-like NADH-dependent reductase (Old Yellow Enzyme family)